MAIYYWPAEVSYRASKVARRRTRTGWKSDGPPSGRPFYYNVFYRQNWWRGDGIRDYSIDEMGYVPSLDRSNDLLNQCQMRAYERFKGAAHNSAMVGVALAEARSTAEMLNNRCVQLYRGFRALAKGDFGTFIRTFNIQRLPKHKDLKRVRSKQAAGLWLEYWLGWAPTVADVYAAVGVLTGELPGGLVTGTATLSRRDKGGWGVWQNNADAGDWDFWAKARVKYSAMLKITNPNLLLANQLGLVNPLSVALELVPFSFIFEWFVNLGQVISTMTDFLGLELVDAYTSKSVEHEGEERRKPQWSMAVSSFDVRAKSFVREVAITPPTIGWRRIDGLSVTRGATAISLLVSLFIPDNGVPLPPGVARRF